MTKKKTTILNESTRLDQQDVNRIRSGDLWCKIQAIGFYRNLLDKLQGDVEDSDWWRFPVQILRHSEISDLYDTLQQRAQRRKIAENVNYRKRPPELEDGDSSDEILDYLYKNPIHRSKLVERLLLLLEKRSSELQELLKKSKQDASPLQTKFKDMKTLFGLSELECQIILFLFLSECGFWVFGRIFTRGHFGREINLMPCLANAIGSTEAQVSKLLGSKENLRRFGLLEENNLELEENLKDFLNGISDTPLCDRYYKHFTGETLPWEMFGKLAEEDGAVLSELIQARETGKGQNILLYGIAGTGKTAFAQSLAAKLGKKLYFINQADSSDSRGRSLGTNFRFAGLEVANFRLDPDKVLVCVDECDKMLANAGMGESIFRMLKLPADRDGEGKGQLNAILDNLKLSVLWIANTHRNSIDPSSRRRFDYNVYFDSLSPAVRRNIWDNVLKRFSVSDQLTPEFLEAACTRYPVNAGGISVAVKNAAAILRNKPEIDFAATVMRYLRSHCNILNIVDNLDGSQPVRDYSLEGLNLKTGPSLERIIAASKHYLKQSNQPGSAADSPRLNLLLFGAPGTGKTEFVKYLAQQLGRPLNIKMASDLLNCYIGETEHHIVNAFREAAAENSILFIDEGDSMLGSRARATRSWEMTQVTTLLNQMENFPGIFIMASNFAQNLDPAAIRRFTFKLHFDYLDRDGKLHFYNGFFKHLNLPELSKEDRQTLAEITRLTPGDFRNVRQQFFYLASEKLSNAEIIKALADETANKNQQTITEDYNDQRKIGFELLKKATGSD